MDLFDQALAATGLDRCTLAYGPTDTAMFGARIAHDPWRLPFYDATHDAAMNAPVWGRRTIARIDGAVAGQTPVASGIAVGAERLGFGATAPVCTAPYDVALDAPLAQAFVDLMTRLGQPPQPGDRDAWVVATAAVPQDLQIALAPVVVALGDAAVARDAAFSAVLSTDADWGIAFSAGAGLAIATYFIAGPNPTQPFWVGLLHDTDYAALYRASVALALTVETAELERFAGATGFSVTIPTPIGAIVLRDATPTTYDPTDPDLAGNLALVVDTGGDDTYRIAAGANESPTNPVSVLVDLAGADTYAYTAVTGPNDAGRLPSDAWGRYNPPGPVGQYGGPVSRSDGNRQGAGRLGIGLLFDLGAGNDHYQSLRMSQGFGGLGVGVLYDGGGADVYEAEDGAQGSAVFGIGVLLDAGSAADRYSSYALSQGFAYAYGFGLLDDAGGADVYSCNVGDPAVGGDPLYLTPQLPGTGNSSFCQGAGFGRRADLDGVYMSGGIGVLRDRGTGGDRYTASVFGTATGYWFGTGLLDDEGGDDAYDGKWYVQGSAAHFALTLFFDEGGNDRYNQGVTVCAPADPSCTFAPAATSIGVGHDFSVAWHWDGGGNDVYLAPGLSLGSGNVNGIGVFVNLGGDDAYVVAGAPTLGAANLSDGNMPGSARRGILTAGAFVDGNGTDTYTIGGTAMALDGTLWQANVQTAIDPTITTEHGVGLDGAGTVILPP